MNVFVIIPTYNEKDNIENICSDILNLKIPSSTINIIIIDDNSPDGTGNIADRLQKENQRIKLINRPSKLGLGSAHIAGMKYACLNKADYVVTMDADFSHNPHYIPAMLENLKTYDIVIGSRYISNGSTENCSFKRIFLSEVANKTVKIFLNSKIKDSTAGFRCYKREVLEQINLDKIFSNGYSFLVEMLYICQQRKFSILEFPIVFLDRTRGISKISKKEVYKAIYTLIRLKFKGKDIV